MFCHDVFRTVSFQKVVKQKWKKKIQRYGFRTVSFQKVVKLKLLRNDLNACFRTVSFQKVVKLQLWCGLQKRWF